MNCIQFANDTYMSGVNTLDGLIVKVIRLAWEMGGDLLGLFFAHHYFFEKQ